LYVGVSALGGTPARVPSELGDRALVSQLFLELKTKDICRVETKIDQTWVCDSLDAGCNIRNILRTISMKLLKGIIVLIIVLILPYNLHAAQKKKSSM